VCLTSEVPGGPTSAQGMAFQLSAVVRQRFLKKRRRRLKK